MISKINLTNIINKHILKTPNKYSNNSNNKNRDSNESPSEIKPHINKMNFTYSHKIKRGANIYHFLKNKYNVKNAKYEDIKAIGEYLYYNNEISLLDLTLMTFDYHKINLPGINLSHEKLLITTREKGRHNWINIYEKLATRSRTFDNPIGAKNNQNIANILKRLS